MEKFTLRRTTKHICHRCKHKYLEMIMQRVSIQDGDYRMWTADRAAHFRSRNHKYPTLAWLCSSCSHPDQAPRQ